MKPGMSRSPEVSAPAEAPFAASGAPSAKALGVALTPPSPQRTMHSRQLFGVANEVLIEHAGFTYRLRITQANKLILTK